MELELYKYKETDIGLIPSDWCVCTLSEAVDFLDGQRRPIKSSDREKVTGDYPYYGASGIIDFVDDYIFNDNLILLGEDGENILSRNLPLAFKVSGKIWVNNHAHVLKPKENFNIDFLTEYLESLDYKLLNSGTAQPKLNKQACLNIRIAVPTKVEQTAIATALSDAENFITHLEKLISKKRLIKQGVMQQLLKPKEGWEVRMLGEVGKCHRGVSYNPERDLHPYDKNITVRLLRSNNIQNQNIDLNGLQYVVLERVKQNQLLQDNDIVICMANGSKQLVGKSAIFKVQDNLKYTFGAFMGCFRTNTELASSSFIALNFQTFQYRNYIDVLLSGSSINNLNPGNIESIEIPFPPPEEQFKIATILSDMDAEITLLETKMRKYKKIKMGMMQNLLNGKIRLV